MKTRGYFGIGVYQPKWESNIGTLWRSAYQMGASFIFIIGPKYRRQASDTTKAYRSIPLYKYSSFEDFYASIPHDCQLVGIEMEERAQRLEEFCHPDRAIYLLGSEDSGLPPQVIERCHDLVILPSIRTQSYNVSVAGSLVMYARLIN